jgi:hypothetical protein
MRAYEQQTETNRSKRSAGTVLSIACSLVLAFSPFVAFAGQNHHEHSAPQPHMQAPHSAPQGQRESRPPQQFHPEGRPDYGRNPSQQRFNAPPQYRMGQQGHLPEWLNRHQNMTPQQRENALRQEPGFNRLPQDQQQRLINRMHTLDKAPPQERQRMLQRNEMFERLNPEQKAGVRGASQAFRQMPSERQSQMRRAFQDLRGVSPGDRQSVLNSARFQHEFSPQERTVLGNMLSVEPYEPRAAGPPQP